MKCPHCGTEVGSPLFKRVDAGSLDNAGQRLPCIMFACRCGGFLGVQIDPAALAAEIKSAFPKSSGS